MRAAKKVTMSAILGRAASPAPNLRTIDLDQRIAEVWGGRAARRTIGQQGTPLFAKLLLSFRTCPARPWASGRARLYAKTCAQAHTLLG